MYYTGIHPMTGKKVYVTTDYREKQLQRALLQYSKPENANLVREALKLCGREDLIGTAPDCLVRPAFGQSGRGTQASVKKVSVSKQKGRKSDVNITFSKTVAIQKKAKKSSKMERIFGSDTTRIRKEADKLSRGGKTGAKKRTGSNPSAAKSKKRS
jgi:hypothetical protein